MEWMPVPKTRVRHTCAKCGAPLEWNYAPSGSGMLEAIRCTKGCRVSQGINCYFDAPKKEGPEDEQARDASA